METWQPVEQHPTYQISNLGRVRHKGKLMHPYPNTSGELIVRVGGRARIVARLMAEVFLGGCPRNMHVAHIDGDKTNNHLNNLQLVPFSEVVKGHFAAGLRSNQGSKHPRAKLNETKVREIRAHHKAGVKLFWLAFKYGVNLSTITHILSRRTWGHVE